MDGRWVIADASDMSKSSDYLHILSKADELSARLTTFAEDLRRRPGLPVSQTLRQDVYQLLLRFTTVRARFVADVVEAGLGIPGLRDLHPEFAIIGRIYASECAFLPGFLKSVEDQLDTEGITHRQDCARGLLLEGVLVRRSSLHLRPPGGRGADGPESARRPLVVGRRDVRRGVCFFTCAGSDFAGCPRLAAGATDSRRFHLVVPSTCVFTSSAAAGYALVGNLRRPAHI